MFNKFFTKRLTLILAMLFALASVNLLTHPMLVLANGDHEPGCPEEALPAWGSFSVDEDDTEFFYGSVSVSNLTYWPRTVEEPS